MEDRKMRIRELVPGEDPLEDVRTWGLDILENLVGLMENKMDQNPLTNVDLDAKDKECLRLLCYTMKDYVCEIDFALCRYETYIDELEEKLKAIEVESEKG